MFNVKRIGISLEVLVVILRIGVLHKGVLGFVSRNGRLGCVMLCCTERIWLLLCSETIVGKSSDSIIVGWIDESGRVTQTWCDSGESGRSSGVNGGSGRVA